MSRTTKAKREGMERIREESRSLDAALRRFEGIMRRIMRRCIGRRVRVMDNWEGTITAFVRMIRRSWESSGMMNWSNRAA